MGIHEVLTLLSFTIFKAHLYIRFQFYLNSLSEAMYMWSVLQLTKHVELYQLSSEYGSKQIELLNEIFKGKSYDVFRVRISRQTI